MESWRVSYFAETSAGGHVVGSAPAIVRNETKVMEELGVRRPVHQDVIPLV